ncbi:hypothetical protein ACTMTJ_08660 [Phytohabitans sp. LJ34]|uniref:hypothetical protein n=1 Tax=Phytohabitans sp. LJ34 TaxID=3452217 RepID=UPI003F895FA5
MKTISTTNSSAATQIPNQAAPVRVSGTRGVGDVMDGPSAACGDAVCAGAASIPRSG